MNWVLSSRDRAVPAAWRAHVDRWSDLRVKADFGRIPVSDPCSCSIVAVAELGDERWRAVPGAVGELQAVGGSDLTVPDPVGDDGRHRQFMTARLKRLGQPSWGELAHIVGDGPHQDRPGLASRSSNRPIGRISR